MVNHKYTYAINWLRHNGFLTDNIDTMTRETALNRIDFAEGYYRYVLAKPEATKSELYDAQSDLLEAEYTLMAVENKP